MAWSFAQTPFLIAGPCVVEPGDVLPRVAERLARFGADAGSAGLLQGQLRQGQPGAGGIGSGPGTRRGPPRARASSARRSGLPVLTDIHLPEQAAPDRRSSGRPPDSRLPLPADRSPRGRGPHRPAGEREEGAVDAARGDGRRGGEGARRPAAAEVAVTERGTFFGYGDLVVDMRNFERLRAATGAPVIFDATHAVQRPGQGAAGASGG